MKRLIFWVGLILCIVACSTQKEIVKNGVAVKEIVNDSLEYDLLTFDVRFESWYQINKRPAFDRSQQYYELWNQQYVDAWNYNVNDMSKSRFFETVIGYDPGVDYGFELNHELFYYFQYVEKILKIDIMPNGPNSFNF